MIYKEVYSFEVIEKLLDGKNIVAVDRKENKCIELGSIGISNIAPIIRCEENGRYLFFYTEVTENETV